MRVWCNDISWFVFEQHWTSETIYTRKVCAKIRHTYEIRVVREPMQKWHADATHNQGFKKLVYRIRNRAVKLAFEEMVSLQKFWFYIFCSIQN